MKGLRVKKAQWLVAKPLVSDKVEQTVHTKIRLFWGKKERTLSDVGSRGTMRERMKKWICFLSTQLPGKRSPEHSVSHFMPT